MGCADMGDDMGGVCDMGPYQHTPPISHTSRCADMGDDMSEVCDMGPYQHTPPISHTSAISSLISAHLAHIIPHISTLKPYQHTILFFSH